MQIGIHDIIDSSIELVADRIHEKNTCIEKSYSPNEITGYWDREQLREVFLNLLANAIDASGEDAPLYVSTELLQAGSAGVNKSDRVRVVVRDFGSGMDEKTRARLFEPFFTTKKRGTGLGMSVVRQIIDLHGGTIDVVSEPAKGTTFTIVLPVRPAVE